MCPTSFLCCFCKSYGLVIWSLHGVGEWNSLDLLAPPPSQDFFFCLGLPWGDFFVVSLCWDWFKVIFDRVFLYLVILVISKTGATKINPSPVARYWKLLARKVFSVIINFSSQLLLFDAFSKIVDILHRDTLVCQPYLLSRYKTNFWSITTTWQF